MHDDDDIERRVKTLHPELLSAYEQMKPIQRADLFRYMVLYDEGGYYADCDVDCTQVSMKPTILTMKSIILGLFWTEFGSIFSRSRLRNGSTSTSHAPFTTSISLLAWR